jgi:hypothetical protein
MKLPTMSAEQIDRVCCLVAAYIVTQRQEALPNALPLNQRQRMSMDGFFRPEILDGTRIIMRRGDRIENPPFYSVLRQMGFTNLPDFSSMAAITFGDVVVSHQVVTDTLLFHELVHVEQYRQLGIPRFAELYVRGFLTGGGYDSIPLEVNAYQLGNRFEGDPCARFAVEDEVRAWVLGGRL